MPFRVSGKNIEVGEALRERISARILEALEKSGSQAGEVRVRENTLEDVFIQLTGRRLRQ